jgi:hypothetical protein
MGFFFQPPSRCLAPDSNVYDYLFGDNDETEMIRFAMLDATTGAQTTIANCSLASTHSAVGGLAETGIGVGDVAGLLSPNSATRADRFRRGDPPCRTSKTPSCHACTEGANDYEPFC